MKLDKNATIGSALIFLFWLMWLMVTWIAGEPALWKLFYIIHMVAAVVFGMYVLIERPFR